MFSPGTCTSDLLCLFSPHQCATYMLINLKSTHHDVYRIFGKNLQKKCLKLQDAAH